MNSERKSGAKSTTLRALVLASAFMAAAASAAVTATNTYDTSTYGDNCAGALVSASLDHVWVKATIGGVNYYFDPSFKPHTQKTGVDLASITGYNSTAYLSAATAGMTLTPLLISSHDVGVSKIVSQLHLQAAFRRGSKGSVGMDKERWASIVLATLDAQSEEMLAACLGEASDRLGFAHCVLTVEIDRPLVGSLLHRTGRFPERWNCAYTDRGYGVIDPILAHSRRSTTPLAWSSSLVTPESAAMWQLARHHGMAHGLSVPKHGRQGLVSTLTLAREDPLPADKEHLDEIFNCARALASCAHLAGARLLVPNMLERSVPSLSGREKQCLQWVAKGLTSREIGIKLHISEPTVVFHLNKSLRKVGVSNRTHAIAVSMALGLLDF